MKKKINVVEHAKFNEWHHLAVQLKGIKENEMRIRKEIAADILEGLAPPCKFKVEINGLIVVLEIGVNYKLDLDIINQIFTELSDEEKSSLKFTPELKLREYKKLPCKNLIKEAITIKPSAPTIKVEDD